MQRLFEALHTQILPLVRAEKGRLFSQSRYPDYDPPSKQGLRVDDFIEAYPYAGQDHSYFEWMWLLEGRAHMKIDGHIHDLAPGDFCFLPPRLLHADVFNTSTPAYHSLWFGYSRGIVSSHFFAYEPVGQWHVPANCQAAATPALVRLLPALQTEMSATDAYAPQACRALIHELVIHLLRALEPVCREARGSDLPGHASRRALQYLREHYAENVTLAEVARAAFLSPHYLSSVFKQETGQTVFDALTQIRMEHARRLLLENQLPVHEIAARVGYSSPHHFSRAFRRSEGVAPSRYGSRHSELVRRA